MSLREAIIDGYLLPEYIWGADCSCTVDADFICPQAFGRNTYSDKTVGPIVLTARNHSSSDIATFKCLKSIDFNPGHPNAMLGKRCVALAKLTRSFTDPRTRPVIGQWEVLYVIWREDPAWYEEHQADLVAIWPPYQGYLGTHGMLLMVGQIASARNLKKPLMVAHPEHIPRCFFLARKIFGAKSVAIDGGTTASEEWFDCHSTQWQTRSRRAWLFYELLARIHHRLHGWM